jgi:hypothetical protein
VLVRLLSGILLELLDAYMHVHTILTFTSNQSTSKSHLSCLGLVLGSDVGALSETHNFCEVKGNIDITHNTSETLVTRSPRVDRNIDKRVNTLTLGYIEVTSHGESLGVVLGVEEVSRLILDTGDSLVVIVDGEIFSLIRESSVSMGDLVSWVPSYWETFSLGRIKDFVGSGVGVVGDGVG